MTLEKAIELLEGIAFVGNIRIELDDVDALKLGIEALKRIKKGRCPERTYVCYLLPGETKD